MNVHSKNGSRGARSRTPKLPLCYYLSATSRIPWNVCEELRPQNLLKNERDGFRSPGRSSQTIACICDLLGEARKPSRVISSIQRHEIKIRHGSQLPEIPINFLAEQLLRIGGRRRHLSCRDGLTFFAVKILHRLPNPSRSPFGSPPFKIFVQ